jgi:hypothetical protein
MKAWTPRHDSLVILKHKEGKSVKQIARDIQQPEYKIHDAHSRLKLKPNIHIPNPKPDPRKSKPRQTVAKLRVADLPRNEDPLADATNILRAAGRLTKRNEIEFLDGSPCDLDRKMTEANRILFRDGRPQLGKKQAWLWTSSTQLPSMPPE